MDISVLMQYANILVVGICLCVGYILKNLVQTEAINKYIPLIMGVMGVVLTVWISHGFSPEILLTGLISGLASTGLYEAFKNLIGRKAE